MGTTSEGPLSDPAPTPLAEGEAMIGSYAESPECDADLSDCPEGWLRRNRADETQSDGSEKSGESGMQRQVLESR